MRSTSYHLIFLLVVILGFWGCRTSDELVGESPNPNMTKVESTQVDYTAIYVIHGDGNYLYHDEEGRALQADEEKVKEAKSVARQAKQGEIFIFYQRPEKKIFWIFPQKDRVLLHYRNGELINSTRYSPASSDRALVAERELYKKYRISNTSRQFFLYFGHEIPHLQERSYHRSRPDAEFNMDHLADGMRTFLDEDSEFDLTVLSTCDNGTPVTAAKMQTLSRYLVASPQNLHLSHIDTEPLLVLEESPRLQTSALADSLARQTYDRLNSFLETSITLSIFNLEKTDQSLNELSEKYLQYFRENSEMAIEEENTDCASLSFWDGSEPSKVFYKPANFGAHSNRESHSGWGCRR